MGFGRGMRVPLWALAFMICSIQQKASSAEGESGKVTIIPPLTTTPVITSFNSAHNGQVCSTWGQFHYKTFDGDIYYFPGTCNYVFASHCNAAYEDFNIQIRRTMVKDIPTISSVTMRLDGTDFEMQKDAIVVNGERVQLPYTGSGFVIEKFTIYVRVIVKLGLTLLWNEKDSLMLELDKKYANQTCGLCGDFNGIPQYNEFFSNGAEITTLQFGNMQKMNGPTEECEDPTPVSLSNCTDEFELCQHVLTGSSFFQCNAVVGVNDYIESCVQDLCLCKQEDITSCLCDTFAEYSRQCAHAGGEPQNWRSPDLCPMECSSNMQYQECESPCTDTCSNSERSQLCEDHCVDGCFCPPGTVYDDIDNAGCIPHEQCSCVYNGKSYAPGTTYSDNCRSCSCIGGQWNCIELPCPGICSVEGGSHISTFDKKRYNVHGDCVYVLSKFCGDDTFSVLGELRKCGLTETETCLKMVALNINGDQTTIVISPNGGVLVNSLYTQLPLSAANVTIFRPSSFFIIVHTNVGLQLVIQLVPTMQLYIHVDPSFKGRTCGLCGNFDKRQMDDFTAISGVVEGTASAFANTWKTQAACPNIKQSFEDPCTLSIENEKYARHWCGLLTDSEGPFAKCHASVNPASYHTNCMFDTCNCERSEDCMCAALSSYVRACAAEKVELPGWRTNVCSRYTTSCPKSLNYSYSISSCQPTCRSLSEPDVTCNVKFVPVDGCTCESGTYMDDYGKCVPANKCPCYYKGTSILSGEVLHDVGVLCTCSQGKLNCIGDGDTKQVCVAPMVYFNCRNATAGQTGAECQKSCQTLDMHCYSTQCVSGCMCPAGLVSDGKGGCIAMEECPCIHNDATYQPGEKIKVNCNTCVCKNRMWECTKDRCLGTCAVYGDGHYITFDDKRYIFNGKCEYTLVQDHCGQNNSAPGTFRVITENVPCGTTGTTCSKSIKVFFGNYDLILSEERHELIQRGDGGQVPYKIRYMGMYLVIEANNGLILLWDKKTSVFIKLRDDFKGQVCGLCGNYDGNGMNDFTTRSQSVVSDVLEFGNSWKVSPTCPEAKCTKDPCFKNPYRKSWAQKQCSIINSKAFAACHSQVEPTRYYEACVTDSCACDTGGDCECFCTAVAAYAQACSEFGVCISWRTPSFCPMFCDYYNDERECEWHYKPCGAPCMKTCRNPSGRCHYQLPGLEGCYPHCPADRPYFNEDEMTCVDVCGCYDDQGNYHPLGKTFDSRKTCQSCTCTSKGIECNYDAKACYCYYEGKTYIYKDVIYNTTDGLGWCMIATCDVNGTIHRELFRCGGTTTISPTVSTTTPSEAESTTAQTTVCVHRTCEWTEWYDVSYPKFGPDNGDYETPEKIRDRGNKVCKMPDEVECRAQRFPNESIETLGQNVQCSKSNGLICNNKDQTPPICLNFEIRFLCCLYTPCGASTYTPITSRKPETTPATPEITTAGSRTTSKVTGGITTTLAPLVTITPGSTTTGCQPKCQWTSWFSFHTPSSDPGDGDREDIKSIQASGGTICEHPQKVECRGVDYPELSASELGQDMICDIDTGLLCENAKQRGKYKICYDYEMRALCCDYKHCETTPAPLVTTSATTTEAPGSTVGKSTAPASSTGSTPPPVVHTTTESTTLVSPTPGVTTGKPTTTETPGSTAGKSTAPAFSTGSTPPPVVFTTTESTTLVPTTPGVTTRKPTTTTHSTPLSTLPLTTPGSVSTAAVSTGVVPTVTATTLQSTPVSKPSSTIPTTGTTAQTPPGLLTTTTTLAPLVTTTPGSTTTGCQPKCQWTSWFSFHTPSSDPGDGDREDIKSIQASGGTICEHPQKVECRGVDYPELSASELGQDMICDIDTGLLCENAKQRGKYKICYDYEMRALCCDYKHCETTPAPLVTTSATTTEAPGSTVGKSTAPASSTGSTPPPVVHTTTESTTLVSPTPGVTTGKPTTTETPGSTAGKSTAPAFSTGSTPPPVVFTTTESTTLVPTTPGVTTRKPTTTTHSTPLSTLPLTTPGSVSTAAVSTGVVPTVTATTLQSTPVSKPSSTIPTTGTTAQTPPGLLTTTTTLAPLVTTTPGSTTTGCQPKCQWTAWFSFHTPSSDPGDGDREDIKSIQASGGTICEHPQKVECRGVDYPELSASELGQDMICDIDTGLLCENAKQRGKYKICYDYEMRALCCDYKHCETTPAPLVTTSATTTEAPGSTVGKSTAPASSTGSTPPPVVHTTTESTTLVSPTPGVTTGKPTTTETPGSTAGKSTAPAFSTGSTPPPVVFTTTESTTLVPTTPGVTTRKPTTTTHSTPLSTLPLTTPGSVSTAAVSTGVVPTVTATTLQSTPVSKPSSTIPTTGTTAQTPPGLLTTTTTLAPLVTTTPGSTTTGCQPKCQWTAWFSFHTPSSDPGDGDREDIKSIQASGGTICEHPQKVECRGVDYPELSASELGQDMICDIDTGLLCENAKQRGKYKICYDYEMRALCCDYKHCETTPAPLVTTSATTTEAPGSTVGKSTAPASSTGSTPPPVVHTTTESTTLVSPTPGVTTGKPTTTETPGSTAGKSTAPASSTGSTPPPVVFTTTESTTLVPTTPGVTTRKPTTTTHSTPLSTLPLTTPGSVSTAAVSTGVVPTVTATTLQSTPVSKPSSTIPTTGTTAQTPPGLLTTTTTLAPLVTTTPGSTTTGCQPKCQWTAWFSFHTPSSDPGDGDREDIKSIQASGGTICEHPQKVECRGVDYPELSASELGQDMICNIDTGLLCENAKQRGKYKICYDYEMRALCCDYKHCETTPAPLVTTSATTTEAPGSTVGKSTAPASSTGSTPPPVVHTTTESTTLVSPTPGVTTGKPTTTETPGSTAGKSTAPASSTGSTPPPVVFTTTESTTLVPTTPGVTTRKPTTTTHSTPLSTLPLTTPGSVSTAAVSTGVVPTVTATTLQSTPVSKPSSTIPTTGTTAQTPPGLLTTTTTLAPLVTTTPGSTTTGCQPKCQWTSWFSFHTPSSDPGDGDREDIKSIQASGGTICEHPQKVECRGVDYPELSASELGQDMICDIDTGLLCENAKQRGKYKICYDYEMRALCCDYKHCETTPAPLVTTSATTTEAPGSTVGKSTAPASSTGSTPPPVVHTTTESTTLVSTTPGVTTGKPTTTETPGSTAGKSTAPASSTGSTPPPVVFTTTESTTLVPTTPGVTTRKPTTTTHSTPLSTLPLTTPGSVSTAATTTESTTLVSTTPGVTTGKPTTTETPGSTAGKSTAPASSTGSTPPPVVFTTTESTTLVPTTPGVTTRKPTTTTHSTPLSTLPLTTPGSVSTAAVSTGVVPTVTATTLQSTPVSKPSSTIPTTGTTAQTPPGLLTTTTTLAPLVTTTPGSTTTGCQPKCQWTSWFSFHTPSSDPGDGDREDIKSIQASGGTICEHPQKVECRGVDYPELSASELGQDMICDIDTGLLCENAKQRGKYKICYDYEMRALCCDYKHCETTPAPLVTTSATTTEAPGSTVGKSTAPASSTGSTPPPVVHTTTESTTLVSTTPGVTTGKPTTTETPGSTAGKSTAPASSTGSTPPPVVFTTTESTTLVPTTPGVTTRKPTTTTHSTPLSTLPLTTPGSVSTAAVSTGVVPTVTATTLQSTPVSKPSSTIPTTGTTAQTPPGLLTTTTTLAPLVTTTPGSTTTGCQPKCQWTSWFSFHTPSSDPGDGDREDIKSIQASGGTICEHPQKVECRGVDYPELSASELGQDMICNIDTGLLCENAKQRGKYKICYDYEMRALCCDYKHCETTPAPLVTTSATTTEAPGSTVGKSTAPASSTGSTPPPVVHTTTESTTLVSTTPGVTTGKPTTTETPGSTAGKSTAPASSTGSTPPPVVFTTTESTTLVPTTPRVTTRKPTTTTHSTPLSTLPLTTPGSVSTAAVSTGVVPTVTATTLQSTPVSKPSSTIPTTGTTAQTPPGLLTTTTTLAPLVTTTLESTSTVCLPKCNWTSWYDLHRPTSSPDDGDIENFETIRKAGGNVCKHPQDIECRAENHPDVSLYLLGQEVQCNLHVGLLCENSKQTDKMCYNFQVRYQCCEYKPCHPSTTPLSTPAASTTEKPGSTAGKSTTPASSTGSTPPPIVFTTTQSSTLVSTTPGVTIVKPTTTETPGSTAVASTVSTTSLPSTHVSKPVSTISTTATSTSIPSTTGTTTVTLSRTTPCFCRVPGFSKGLFSPGEVIYNRTDSSGCSFYAVCNRSCEIEVFQGPCPSTTPSHPSTPSVTTAGTPPSPSPTTVVPSTGVYTTAAVSTPTTPVTGCPDIDPPRKTNETWMFNNCTVATCEGNNKIVLKPQPPVEKTVCVSGLPPIKIVDKDGCVERYECECICTGWDANYVTFDGTYYTFYDNCTYILVKEIVNIHGNLSVLLDNYFCDVTNNQPCSRAIIVNYNSMEVVLSSEVHEGVRINKIFFNHEPVNGDFTKYGISVTSTGTVMSVEIPALQAFISFNGLTFSVKLPFDLFQHNTEGQCGVCSNDKTDDCRLPNGHEASSCTEMASYWKTYDKNKPHCYGVPTTSPPTTTPHEPRTTTPAPTPCTTPSPLCELIVSDVFEECHKVLPPRIYYEDCLLEACQSSNDSVPCYNLEIYASLCIAKGVCTDWRNMTLGKCPYHCPKDKVYNACGPIHPVTCDDGPTKDTSEHVAEGCFCPEDKILFNTYTDICVKTCGCVGPDGLPKPPGSSWKSNCQECICDPLTESVQCKPQTCVSSEPPKCEKEGFVPVPVLTPKDPCCPELQCKCNTTTCSNEKKPCELGYEATPVLLEGDCCVSFPCIPIPDVCLVNGTLYRAEMPVPSKPCETCVCSSEKDPDSNTNLVKCQPVTCDKDCQEGYEYQVEAGECCGKCVQNACIINMNETTEILQPGDIWPPGGNNCSYYECEQMNDTFILVQSKRKCPIIHPEECESHELELTPDGCCETCKPKTNDCKVHKNQTLIRQSECLSSEVVELTYCEGACPSSSKYSSEANAMQRECTCCQELKSHRRKVTLTCQDGKIIDYDYIYVDECQCMTACIPQSKI
uniref:mucin-5B-like n=1 Tax=Podarcis muralis TaxID=64176 RepID=UPI00109FEF65|nr:mucin-5B-like [Podarcis muralis]